MVISPKRTCTWANRHIKRCSMALIVRETQTKTTMRRRFPPVRMAVAENPTNKCWWVYGGREPSCAVGGIAKWCRHCEKRPGGPSQKEKQNCLTAQPFQFCIFIQRNPKHWFEETYSPLCSLQFYLQLPKCGSNQSVHQQMNKVHIYIMEYYSAIKRNEILPFARTWMDLEGTM